MHSNTDTPPSSTSASVASGADHWAGEVNHLLQDAQQLTDHAAHSITQGVDDLRNKTSGALSQAAAQAEELARRGMGRARDVAGQARERATAMRDFTVGHVQADPMKAVLVAAATGAATALLLRWLSRSRRSNS